MPDATHQLAAIMFTDIVGYTALMGDDEQKAINLLEKNRKLQKPLIDSYGGRWIKEIGDGVLATFSTVSDAVYCAVDIQKGSKDEFELNLRIGIHQGEVVYQDGDVFGDGVNIASRLEQLAPSGGITISESVNSNIQNKEGIETQFISVENLKNVKEPVRIYEVKVEGVDFSEPTITSHITVTKSKSSSKVIYLTLAVIVIALLSYWGYGQFYSSPPAETEDITIAVLAFDDQSPNGDQEWLGDGMADEILNVLAKVNGLQVTGKTSSFSFKGKGLTTKVIGETLNVTTVLEGSVSKIGDKLRITAQLIDVETDAHIWSKKYDRDAVDIFNIMDEVAQSIATSLRSELSIEDLENIKVGSEVDPDAYEYYLKGMHFHWQKYIYSGDSSDFLQSEKMFTEAISIDSSYVEAYAGLADLYDTRAAMSGAVITYHMKRDSVVSIAYRINPNSAYVLTTKGMVFSRENDLNLDSAFHYYNKAHLLDPSNIIISSVIIDMSNYIGLYKITFDLGNKIIKNDPLNNFVRIRLANALLGNGQVDEAKENFIKVLEVDGMHQGAYTTLFVIEVLYNKDKSKADSILKKLQRINPDSEFKAFRAWLLALDGKNEEALRLNQRLVTYSILNMKKEVLNLADSINSETEYTSGWTYLGLLNHPIFDFIREEPEFQVILAEAKKVHEERMAKYGHLFDE